MGAVSLADTNALADECVFIVELSTLVEAEIVASAKRDGVKDSVIRRIKYDDASPDRWRYSDPKGIYILHASNAQVRTCSALLVLGFN